MFIVDKLTIQALNHTKETTIVATNTLNVLNISTIVSVVVLLNEEGTTQETKSCYPCNYIAR